MDIRRDNNRAPTMAIRARKLCARHNLVEIRRARACRLPDSGFLCLLRGFVSSASD
jgi:hypothetical protein